MYHTGTVRGVLFASVVAAVGLCLVLMTPQAGTAAPASLQEGFANPPDSAKPQTWWHWMNGNISREGITRDLEAMKRVGVGGAQIFDVTDGIPPGPVKYMSDEWRGMVKHAVTEADRLGLEICIHNCAGWSSSGGPWIDPAHAMQMVTVSETRVTGPTALDEMLPQPRTRLDFYRDIAVLAFPTPPAEAGQATMTPTVTASAANFDVTRIVDGDPGTSAALPMRGGGDLHYVAFECPEPFTARAITVVPGVGRQSLRAQLQVSEDGEEFRTVADFGIGSSDITRQGTTVGFEPATGRYFRLVFLRGGSRSFVASLAEIRLESGYRIRDWATKAGYRRGIGSPDRRTLPADAVIRREDIRDLSKQLDETGRLQWAVPGGDWTILRFGYTPTGKQNHPASIEGIGLECDKLSREAAEVHFAGMLGKVIADIGPLAGKSLKHVLIDSYEVYCQNWTPRMREDFLERRGYDMTAYLPAMTGRVVDSLDNSQRFLWDLRRTLGDLFADNYYGHFATLCHAHGIQLSVEAYGNGNFDNLTAGGRADIPMGEFWAGSGNSNQSSKQAASVAHTYGRTIVGAESFTAGPENGKWQNHPYALKTLGDLIYCGGVNRFIFHRYAHQPWENLLPGMTMGPHGFHFERTVTWWDQSPAWLQYLARCQHMLQSGLFAADLCYFYGEQAPNDLPARSGLKPRPPDGYDYDGCNAEVILTRMFVEDGRIVLPDGMSYRILVLPPSATMTPALLGKIRDLVNDGATVCGPKPKASPGLQGYPDSDAQVRALADEIWGPCDGETVTRNTLGKGVVIDGEPIADVLTSMGIAPDFQSRAMRGAANLQHIHRTADGAELYFISNQKRRVESVECSFRVTGKIPELWNPLTGRMQPAPVYSEQDGRTIVPLRLEPAGSVFVVFREPSGGRDHVVEARRNGEALLLSRLGPAPKLEILDAVYGVLSGERDGIADVTQQVSAAVRNGTLRVRADNSIAGDPAPQVVKALRVDYTLNGQARTQTVVESQTLSIPASEPPEGTEPMVLVIKRALYGVLPDEPAALPETPTVDVTKQLAALVRDNTLSVIADNSIAGDPAQLVVKQLRVSYTLDGKPYTRTIGENQSLDLPEGTEASGAFAALPAADMEILPGGELLLTPWEPGDYEFSLTSGKTLAKQVATVPEPLDVTGPWEVRFPPNLGAPAKATFEGLASWTESEEPGIRFFSGTATYTKELRVPAEFVREGTRLMLDLGVVREIAEVRLNGKNLGILWKPPFRVDVTDAIKPGANALEISVTNLWPNRLIGDEQLPAAAEFSPGGPMKAVPEWLLAGAPPPETGRITFTTWKHYSADSTLLESGLLGPVTLRAGEMIRLTP